MSDIKPHYQTIVNFLSADSIISPLNASNIMKFSLMESICECIRNNNYCEINNVDFLEFVNYVDVDV